MKKKNSAKAIKDLTIMLMYLTRIQDSNEFCRFREMSWKGYDFGVLEELAGKGLVYQPESNRGYNGYLYLTETGRTKAIELLEAYNILDKDLNERFKFRNILQEEAEQAALIEQICFPPNEACSESMMKERIARAPELFLAAVDKSTGKIAGFLNGLSTNEHFFRDEFFTDAELHEPEGANVMLLGLDVLPEYRGQGLAKEIMHRYLRRESEKGRKVVILTCLKSKVGMYEKLGFQNRGKARSSWGGEQWYEMSCTLND